MLDKKHNPWLGLESYQENQIIYGRNEEIEDLSLRVLNDIDTLVYGKSGIGKTSIINAGVLPIVRKNGFVPIVLRLDHNNNKSYISQIKEAIGKDIEVVETASAKNVDKELFWEFFHRHKFFVDGERIKLILVFDQFEEMFTIQQTAAVRTEFFKEFAYVLNNAMPKELAFCSDDLKTEAPVQSDIQVEGFASMSNIFNNIKDGVVCPEAQYVNDNNIHFIFILREDFLSEFEFYTTKIPSLKLHRFALRPLNEEQAAEIITKPRPGFISIDVAHLIIETITGRSDFSLGNEPEIEVDAAVLSLFLSRIYQKLGDNDDVISAQIVKQFGANIIKDFYLESIESLTDAEIYLLEDKLLTSNNHRNNISYSDFCRCIDKNKIDSLIHNKKLLRTFNYGNDIRVEFIHDILCPIIKEIKDDRLAKKMSIQEKNKKKLYKSIIYTLLFSLFLILWIYPYFSSSNINIQLIEANTISNEEYWKACVTLIDGNDTIAIDTIDKGRPSATFSVYNYRKKHVFICNIDPLIGNIKMTQEQVSTQKTLNYIQIDKINPEAFIKGNVRVATGSIQPVIGAIVIWGNQVTKTDSKGNFSFNKPNDYSITSTKDSTIKIIKNGYEIYEDKLHTKSEKYKLRLKSPNEFYDKCNFFESKYSSATVKENIIGQYIFNNKVVKDIELFVYKDVDKSNDAIRGFYYYKNNRVEETKDKHSLYILFEGYLSKTGDFVVNSTDDAWNTRTLSGKIINNKIIKGQVHANNFNYAFEYIADKPFVFIK